MTLIAQNNVARRRHAMDDPRFAPFMDNLARINALAERAPGFVWRLQGAGGNATDLAVADPEMIVNVSVWESVEDLERFVFGTIHHHFYRRRAEWFAPMATRSLVLWEVDDDHRPDLAEAMDRLAELDRTGPTERVWGWEEMPSVKLWMEKRCG